MQINSKHDFYTFLFAFLVGIFLSLIGDLISAFRKTTKSGKIAVFIQDIIYSIIAGISTYIFLFLRTNGIVRWYVLISIAFGFIFAKLLITKFSVKLFKKVLFFIKKYIVLPISRFLIIIEQKINDFFDNLFKKCKKKLER